jgi:putative thioredoxin
MSWFSNLFNKEEQKQKKGKRAAIIDVTDANFQQQVIQRSYKALVLVDFWAAWCGPCRQLGPVLETLAEDPEQTFYLAKLDTEANRKTAAKYQIRSIPNVKAFQNGRIVDEFTGARPGVLVKRFIGKIEAQEPPPPALKISKNNAQRLRQGEQYLKKGRGFEAFVTLNDFPESDEAARAAEILPLARFLFDMDDGDALTGLEALDDAYKGAAKAFKKRQPRQAVNYLFTALDAGEEMDHEYTLEIINAAFALLGADHKVTQEFKGRLAEAATGVEEAS